MWLIGNLAPVRFDELLKTTVRLLRLTNTDWQPKRIAASSVGRDPGDELMSEQANNNITVGLIGEGLKPLPW